MTDSMVKRLRAVLESGVYTNGPFARQLESEYKSCFNLKGECVAVNGCQSGLMLCLQTLDVHMPVVSDFTFSATANAAYWTCKRFSVADINPKTFNLALRKLPDDIDCVLPTHVFGNPCECEKLEELCEPEHIPLIYDAAHAHGASFNGVPIGDYGTASVFSMSPTKQVTSGEGGMVVTKDKDLADKLRILRNYGTELGYEQFNPGLNARMSEFHAVVGLESIARFWPNHSKRLALIEQYLSHFEPGIVQKTTPKAVHAWKDFAVFIGEGRDKVAESLLKQGIESKQYFKPISSLSSYKSFLKPQSHAYWTYRRIIQLPLHGNMRLQDVDRVCEIVKGVQ